MDDKFLNVENSNFIPEMEQKCSTMQKIKTNLDLDLYLNPDSVSCFHLRNSINIYLLFFFFLSSTCQGDEATRMSEMEPLVSWG